MESPKYQPSADRSTREECPGKNFGSGVGAPLGIAGGWLVLSQLEGEASIEMSE